jgi:formylglycine-generating enzyme required for sulfatase activity
VRGSRARTALGCAAALALSTCGHDAAPPAPASAAPSAQTAAPLASASAGGSAPEPEASPAASPVVDAGADAGADAAAPLPGMIAIPAGIFLMGSPVEHGSPEERPMHEAIVAAFDLDRTEVTTRDYLACMSAGACSRPHEDNAFCNTSKEAAGDRGDHPANCVDFHQATAYCAFAGKRLPTEREWEYAARGGDEERRYSWGEEDPTPERACYTHRGSCPVASFAPGAFGLEDMSGNVWEWTSSWFGPYPDEATTGVHRVYRGGSWSRRFPKWLSTAMRNRYEPGSWSAALGMRCARSRLPLTCPDESEARGGACVRSRGKPRCEPTLMWNGDACTPGGGPSPKPGLVEPASGPPADEQPVTHARTPEHDGDCQSHYAGKPAAYRYSGATFHARNRPLEAAGCTRRDMGLTWTSVCCPR